MPFFEPGLGPECLAKALEIERLRFTTDLQRRPRSSATCTSCASAPRRQPGSAAADLSYLNAAVEALAPHLKHRTLDRGQVDGAGRHRRP